MKRILYSLALTLVATGSLFAQAICIGAGCGSGGGGGGGGGGGASNMHQLTDGLVTRTSSTVINIAAFTTPVGLAASSPLISAAGNATIGGSSTGTAFVYISGGGAYTVGYPASGWTLSCDAGCTATPGVTSLPGDAIWLATVTATGGTWDSPGVADKRQPLRRAPTVVAGSGASVSQSGDVYTVSGIGGSGGSGPYATSTDFPMCMAAPSSGAYGPAYSDHIISVASLQGLFTGGDSCWFQMANGTAGTVVMGYTLPASYDSGAITLSLLWGQNNGGTGNVQWSINATCDSTVFTTATYNTAVTVTTAVPSSNQTTTSTVTLPTTGCAPRKFLRWKISNVVGGATTYTSPENLVSVSLGLNQ